MKRSNYRLLSKSQHRKIAAKLFNHTWTLSEKKHRSKEEDAEMIRDAHASLFHWKEIGTPRNFSVGEWQIARVYSLLGMSESALFHAKRSLALAKAGRKDFEDFHLPSAYEGMARAYASAGNMTMTKKYVNPARRFAMKIKDDEDRKTILKQIDSILLPRSM